MTFRRGIERTEKGQVLSLGFFDGVHRGHQKVLTLAFREADQLGKRLEILTFYPHPVNFLNFPNSLNYLTTYQEKYQLIQDFFPKSSVRFLRFNQQLRSTTPESFVQKIGLFFQPEMVVVGKNFRFGVNRRGDSIFLKEKLEAEGIKVKIVPTWQEDKQTVSSSKIRFLIEKGFISKANQFLGYPFFLMGRVRKGKGMGRKLGFPTANLYPPVRKILPPPGVYFGYAQAVNLALVWPALIYVGTKPSLEANARQVVEVYCPDLSDKNLYQEKLAVYFLQFSRAEKVFPDLTALQAQIAQDLKKFQQYLHHHPGMINYLLNVKKLEV